MIASATAVLQKYYSRYARFLASHGFRVITFDYRGIGESRGGSLRGQKVRWFQWGALDIDAVLAFAFDHAKGLPVHYVGHSYGGYGVGLAAHSAKLTRILTVGAQHAYWRDLRPLHMISHWSRAALMVPLVGVLGYFPAKRLGLMEDLPAGVALDWARSRKDFRTAAGSAGLAELRSTQQSLTAPILAVAPTDDSYATRTAMERAVAYTPNAPSTLVQLHPELYGLKELGHFALFHSRFEDSFWQESLFWLRDGQNPY